MDSSSDKTASGSLGLGSALTSGSLGLGEIVGKETIISEAYSLLDSGKQLLMESSSNSIPQAVSDLAECCELLAKVYGETGEECAEAYYYYGKALLEESRLESRVLGNALDGVDMDAEDPVVDADMVEDPETMSKDEKLEVEGQVAEALEENFESHDRVARTHTPVAEDAEDEDAMEEDGQDEVEAVEGEEAPTKTEEKVEDMEDEDPGNLQLAWEMLELAKVAYTKTAENNEGDKKKELQAKLCETYLGP